jgi:hypothetical protein
MSKEILDRDDYRQDYLPWANSLVNSEAVAALVSQAESDKNAFINTTVVFQPPLDKLAVGLQLPEEQEFNEEEDTVNVVANFDAAQLRTIGINSLKGYLVLLNFYAERWPIKYLDDTSREKNLLVTNELLRERTERLVVRTSSAMLKHVVHRVPIGDIPEEALDWTIDEGELEARALKALNKAGITTYGDLGILSINQLQKIFGIGTAAIEDIKNDLLRHGWLSAGYKKP